MTDANKNSILLVEDEAIIALSEKKALEKYGYDVITALSGEDAIDIARRELNLDLILMDIDLGKGIDGSRTAQIILEQRELPVVFLSSHIEPQVVERTELITSYGYILKSSSITVLDASIKMAFKLFEANKKLANEKEHLRTTLNSIGDAVICTDTKGNITRMNPVAEKLTGWAISEAEGRPILDVFRIVNADSGKPVESPVEKVLQNGYIVGLANHTVLISKNGTENQIADSGSPITNSSGNITGVVLVFRDVTEEYKIQKAMMEKDNEITIANEMFQKVLDSIPQFICWKNRKSVFLGCNKNYAKMAGLTDTQSIIGKTDWDLPWKKEETEHFLMDDAQVMESNAPKYHIIEPAFDANGRETWLDTNKVPIHDTHGEVNGIIVAFSDITERKSAMEELAHDQYLLQALLNTSSDRIYFKDNECKFIRASMAQAKLFGLSDPVYMIGRSDFDYFSEEHAKQAYEDEKTIIATGESLRKEEKETWEGQPDTWVITEKMPLCDNEGNIIGTFGISKDITARKRTEEALAHEQYLLQTLMDTTPDHIFFKDTQSKFIKVSKSQLQKFGLSDYSKIIGKSDFDFFSHEHAQQAYDDERNIIKTGRTLIKEEKETWENKPDTWAYSIKMPLKDRNGIITGTFGISRDITELKGIQEALRESNERCKVIIEKMSDYIFTVYLENGRIVHTYHNQACISVTGYSTDEFSVDPYLWFNMVLPEDRNRIEVHAANILAGRNVEAIEHRIRKKFGEIRWIRNTPVLHYNSQGVLVSYNGIIVDITEHKQAEEEIQKLLQEKEIILKEVHHRIKNNMNAIQSLLILQASTLKNKTAISALKDAASRVRSMTILYKELYNKSSFESAPTTNYLSVLVEDIVNNFPNSEKVDIELRIEDFEIPVKSLQPLGIILTELLTNIMKYAFEGRESGKITVIASLIEGEIHIEVVDNGIGLPDDVNFKTSKGFGMMLIDNLTNQLGGVVKILRDNGTRVILEFDK
jgi:PAS domain S-box-containing protein